MFRCSPESVKQAWRRARPKLQRVTNQSSPPAFSPLLKSPRRQIFRDPITRFADHSTQQVCCTMGLGGVGPAGQVCTLFVLIEADSQVAEQPGELAAGDAALVAAWEGVE